MIRLIPGDALEQLRLLPGDSVHCCVTSPPYYGLRDYGVAGQIGLEPSPDEYIAALVAVFREVRRVLHSDGTLWLNIGDSYAGSWGAQSRGNFPSAKSTLTTNGGKGPKAGDKYSVLSATQIVAHPHGTHTGTIRQPGLKPKDLIGIPWMLAFALRADGWYLRQDIIWSKPNPMPESVTDRCTKAHEYLFLLSRSERYWFDTAAIAEPLAAASAERYEYAFGGAKSEALIEANIRVRCPMPVLFAGDRDVPTSRNKRSVWTVTSKAFSDAHFATFPPALIEPCILAGCPKGGTVLDPFGGAGTTGLVADRLGRDAILIELNPAYCSMIRNRITNDAPLFVEFTNAAD